VIEEDSGGWMVVVAEGCCESGRESGGGLRAAECMGDDIETDGDRSAHDDGAPPTLVRNARS
jgi:hypothetical protein